MIDKAILAKIRKCLALSKSANEHEAAAALGKARAIMAEHSISDAMLDLADIEEATARAGRAERAPRWEVWLCAAVRRAFGVTMFRNEQRDRTYVGRGARPEIAAYAFTVLFRQLKRCRADYITDKLKRCKPARKRQRADMFCEGWAGGVYDKIAALVPDAEPDAGLNQYLAVQYPDLVKSQSRAAKVSGAVGSDDYWRGVLSGSKADLHGGVGAAAAPVLLT